MTSTRRNGQALPCEPCRKAKIRCDGATPTCQNCVRRNKGDSCAYTPVPASRTWYSDNAPSPTASPRPQTAQPRPDSAALQNRASFNAGDDKLSFDFATNNSATFSDIGDQFKRSLVIDAPSAARPDTKQIQLGARLLTLLFEHFALYERLSETAVEVWPEGCVLGHRLVSGMFEALEDLHGALAADAKDLQSSLLRWSQKIFEDSSKPLAVQPTMSPDDYIRRISGRWEGIGLVFTIVGQGAMLERDWRSIRSSEANVPRDQKSLAAQAISASDACLQFCDLSTAVNDPLGWLLFQHIHLLTLLCGENDPRAWRRLADLSTTVFTLSHNAPEEKRIPFFLLELRKRLVAGAYSIDKQLATFLGRPPQISWRYYDVQFPLDLSYEEILAEPKVREAAISLLDKTGWNTQGIVGQAAWMRIALLIGSTREQILELSLSRRIEDLPRKVQEVSQQSHKTWNDLPGFLRWRPSDPDTNDSSVLVPLYLNFLYNDFLLYRVLVRRAQSGSEGLVSVSQNILSTILELIGKEIGSRTGTYNVGYNAASFGVPAAGVLAIELLCQAESQSQLPASVFRRSEVIQKLTVFASHLQYVVRPHDGMYEVCQRARRVISSILDRILSVNPPALPATLPPDVLATNWLNGEIVVLDDGTDLFRWIDSASDTSRRGSWA
ncbi:transcriptional regulator family: Fungal Specific TF [Aspergillus niger]|uniref:C6 transcription factor n=3 Tax=Aspergillus TaxID=5052 RepID=A0A3F3QHH4_9EURO|nr:C6 transcription factor [Aspergillus welwitschiae]KAI2938233.1 transcriptional regulator family: Fungal Specific TF [Aspergillus niger]RDK47676.1 C6 transcription factor [Aspergillus phoenicis ATCC 13157]KAI2977164.1 transcriptional regulator family: Fungal Specific TF [Aspergillus niger]KAI3013064.1 transcriptional regulator family: Fungal Specific TF [Aspergillus niger]KAI3028359.1 transcriptional regulator family: Fungal Specific TF [Aspergillus niger]